MTVHPAQDQILAISLMDGVKIENECSKEWFMTRSMNWQFVPHATLIRIGNHRFKNCYEIVHDLLPST